MIQLYKNRIIYQFIHTLVFVFVFMSLINTAGNLLRSQRKSATHTHTLQFTLVSCDHDV